MVGPGGLLADPGAMDAAHGIVATSHSSMENDPQSLYLDLHLLGMYHPCQPRRGYMDEEVLSV